MLFKGIICIFILLAGVAIGQLKAKTYDNRVYHLQELITMLKVLESEMKYRTLVEGLQDVVYDLSNQTHGSRFLHSAQYNPRIVHVQ